MAINWNMAQRNSYISYNDIKHAHLKKIPYKFDRPDDAHGGIVVH